MCFEIFICCCLDRWIVPYTMICWSNLTWSTFLRKDLFENNLMSETVSEHRVGTWPGCAGFGLRAVWGTGKQRHTGARLHSHASLTPWPTHWCFKLAWDLLFSLLGVHGPVHRPLLLMTVSIEPDHLRWRFVTPGWLVDFGILLSLLSRSKWKFTCEKLLPFPFQRVKWSQGPLYLKLEISHKYSSRTANGEPLGRGMIWKTLSNHLAT